MLTSAFFMLMSSAFLMLRIGANAGSFPRTLSKEEEASYVELAAGGDIEARNKLIEHNLRLVAHIIKKYYTQVNDHDDLISIGTIGLIKGISTYRPEKGVRLATYASKCIENEILMYFRGTKKMAGDVSLSESIDVDGDGNSLSLMDVLTQDDDMFERVSLMESYSKLNNYIEQTLTDREAKVIRMRYGLGGWKARTQREVASDCDISRSYVSRIEKKALEKLRMAMGDGDF